MKLCKTLESFTSLPSDRPIRLTECSTQFKSVGIKVLCVLHLHDNVASHLNDMEILGTKRFILKGFELGTTLSYPNRSMRSGKQLCSDMINH